MERSYSDMMRLVFKQAPTYVAQTRLKLLNNSGMIRRSSYYTGEYRRPGDLPIERNDLGRDASNRPPIGRGRRT